MPYRNNWNAQTLNSQKTRVKYILYTLTICLWGFSLCLFIFHLSRLRLLPGFLSPEEADWMFSKLLAELPWSQKTNYRQGEHWFLNSVNQVKCEFVVCREEREEGFPTAGSLLLDSGLFLFHVCAVVTFLKQFSVHVF